MANNEHDNNRLRNKLLARLIDPFPDEEISWKPCPTRTQTEQLKQDSSRGVRCKLCSGWHHPQASHLAYVGHAAVTKRLLDIDPTWNWEFLHTDGNGLPIFDTNGGLWITLTILGVTRKGYGAADQGKSGPNAVKEVIGDAIRNAAMRFGVALELWHNGGFAKNTGSDGDQDEEGDFYPDDKFRANLDSWVAQISNGRTAAQIIDFLGKKNVRLTPAQINTIKKIGEQ